MIFDGLCTNQRCSSTFQHTGFGGSEGRYRVKHDDEWLQFTPRIRGNCRVRTRACGTPAAVSPLGAVPGRSRRHGSQRTASRTNQMVMSLGASTTTFLGASTAIVASLHMFWVCQQHFYRVRQRDIVRYLLGKEHVGERVHIIT